MDDHSNILIFSKDNDQGAIIQDNLKAAGYDSQVFDLETTAYESFPVSYTHLTLPTIA